MKLTDREQVILEALVERFTIDAGPVSSGQLVADLELGLSSATVRNVLHGLEEKGLLSQPHTSAGRVPTREAYRLYVDSLVRPARLPLRWLRRIRQQVDEQASDVHELLVTLSSLLAGFTNNVGVGLAVEDHRDASIERVEIIQIASERLLVVVTLDDGDVRTSAVPTERSISSRALEVAVGVVNELVAGKTPAEARLRLEMAVDERFGEAWSIARSIVKEKDRLFQDGGVPTLHLEGASEILGQPEFKNPENLRVLVRILDQPQVLQSVLRDPETMTGVSIRVGVDSQSRDLQGFSLVSAPVALSGRIGVLGVFGPLRMDYPVAMSLVSSVVEVLNDLSDQGN